MRLSQQTKNAIAILVHFARQPDATRTVPEIAQACDITEYNVFKLVPLLTRAGFLRTIQGRSACLKAKQLFKRLNKPFLPVGSSGRGTFSRALVRLAGELGTAAGAA